MIAIEFRNFGNKIWQALSRLEWIGSKIARTIQIITIYASKISLRIRLFNRDSFFYEIKLNS